MKTSRTIFSLLITPLFFWPQISWAVSRSFEPSGLTSQQVFLLKSEIPSLFTQNFTFSDLDQALRVLFKTERFEGLKIVVDRSDIAEKFKIIAAPVRRISKVIVNGNRSVSNSEIIEALGIEVQNRFDRNNIIHRESLLKSVYSEKGYLNVLVELSFKESKDNDIVVTVDVRENQPTLIAEIQFTTPNEDLRQELGIVAKPKRGLTLTADNISKLQNDLQIYLSKNRYLNSQISNPELKYNSDRSQVSLIFIVERPFKFTILIQGTKILTPGLILKELDLERPNALGANPVSDISAGIERIYQRRGFANVNIGTSDKLQSKSYNRIVTYAVDEGHRVKIRNIDIEGSLSRPQKYYSDFIIQHSSDLVEESFYNRTDLDIGVRNLVTELQNQGFLKAKAMTSRTEFDKAKRYVDLSIQVDEGPLTVVKSIQFSGAKSVTQAELLSTLGFSVGAPLHLTDLELGIERIKNHYLARGHLDVTISNEKTNLVKYNSEYTEASIDFEIYEGPAVTVGSIVVEGNIISKASVILRELEFKEGDLLTPQKIDDSKYRLQRLGLFGTIDIHHLEVGTGISERTIIVRVSERSPGLFNSGLGVNTEFQLTVRAYTGLGYQNLGGTARAISARVELKRITDIEFIDRRITLGYLEPYIIGSRIRGRFNLSQFNSVVNRFRTEKIQAREGTEFEFNLERDFSKHFKLTWNAFSIAFLRDYELGGNVPILNQVIGSVGPSLEIDYRDNIFLPRKGFYSKVSAEYSDPYLGSSQGINYFKSNAAFNYYIPLFNEHLIWAQSIRGGYLANVAAGGLVPEAKVFFLGGRSSIRGFNVGKIPPSTARVAGSQGVLDVVRVRSDSHFYVTQNEIRIPIKGNLESVLFYDGGAVQVTGFDFENSYRQSVGLGFRYNTPVGAVSAEYGLILDRRHGEDQGLFHFSIGTF